MVRQFFRQRTARGFPRGARDLGDHRVPPTDHRAGDPGDRGRRSLRRAQEPAREIDGAHPRPEEGVGNPLLYGTTKQFLVHFGLNQLEDLPSIEEFDEFIGVLAGARGAATAPDGSNAPEDE
jgi:hypothetical protein